MKYLVYSVLLTLGVSLFAIQATGQSDSLSFPQAWEGEWTGDLVISTGVGEAQRIPMILRILPVEGEERHTFTIVYGEDTPENTRPYFIQAVDGGKGHYEVDEANGIILDDFLINGKLYSRFEVMGSLLLTTLEERDGQLIYEIIAGPLEPIRTTGGTVIDEEEIPPVNGYQIRIQQRAVLDRKNG